MIGFILGFQIPVVVLGRSSVEAWYTTALDIEEVLSGVVDSDVHLLWLMLLSPLIRWIGVYWIGFCVVWVCQAGFGMLILSSTLMLDFVLSWQLGWAGLGLGMGGIPQGCPLSMMFVALYLYLPWCGYLGAQEGVQPQVYADNL